MNEASSSPWPRWVARHARAAFVIFHVVAITLIALPGVGGGMNRRAWKTPTVQEEFSVWADRLGMDVGELEDVLWRFAVSYEDGRREVMRPMMPYLRYSHSAQSWRMFVAPHRYPGRLVIEVDHGDGFKRIYEGRSATLAWRRHWFDHDRMRSAVFRYAWKHYSRPRRQFVDWVARHVADDFPEARRVRVGFLRYRTLSPEEVRAGVAADAELELAQIRSLEGT